MKQNSALILLTATALAACGGGSSSNQAPVFEQASYQITTTEDQATTITVAATDKTTVTYGLANASANATIDINNSTGVINYQPNLNFNGQDSFQVSATDGEETVAVTVNVSVGAVNDAPELNATEILVSGGETKKGLLSATDVDGDVLGFTVTETTKNGDLTIDATTGEVTYKPQALIDVNDSFTVLVSDGNGGELSKELTIKASLATNADRSYYYYANERSHLKQAEQHITSLNNDINQGLVFNNLAVGYAEAGLTEQVTRVVSAEQIVRDEMRARTLLDVSFKYNALGLVEKAEEYRTLANTLYTQYVATKGITTFGSDDAIFFQDLSQSYQAAGETEKALQALGILDLLFATALDGNSTTSALRTFFTYQRLVETTVENWQTSRSQTDFELAHSMTARLYSYANLISHRFVSNDRNGNEGKPFHSVRQVALSYVVDNYMELNDFDNAKEVLHDILALHGVVGVDENYPRTADEYAQVTRVEYEYGLYGSIESFVVLYPDAELDLFLGGFPEGSFWAQFAQEDAADALLMSRVRNMTDKDAALALVIAEKDPSNLRNHFTNLVAFNSSSPGGAIYLRKQGNYVAAAKFLTESMQVLNTDEYIAQNLTVEAFVTGQTGCQNVVEEFFELYRLSGDASYQAQAQTTIDTCITIAKNYYAEGTDGSDISIKSSVDAHSRFLVFAKSLNISDEISVLLSNIENNIANINSQDYAELTTRLQGVGMALAVGGKFTEAQAYYDRAIAQLALLESTKAIEEVGQETAQFFNYTRSDSDYTDYLNIIESNAGIIDNYIAVQSSAYQAWENVVENNLAMLAEGANQQKLAYLAGYANQYMRLGEHDKALELANDEALGVVEKESIITEVANSLSVQDHFTQTLVASVDTDGDGKANFFLGAATEDDIANAGISLDEDSDNDGVNDELDAYPLDENQQ
jgi:hypothetical protein